MKNPMLEFGQWMRSARMSAGLTQRDLADSLGIPSRQAIANMERGMTPLPARYVKRFSRATKTDVSEVIGKMVETYEKRIRQKLAE